MCITLLVYAKVVQIIISSANKIPKHLWGKSHFPEHIIFNLDNKNIVHCCLKVCLVLLTSLKAERKKRGTVILVWRTELTNIILI